MAVVKSASMSEAEILKIIKDINDSELYFLRSRIDDVELDTGKDKLLQNGIWETGRLFNKEYEVRWRFADEDYRLTLLTESEKLHSVLDEIDYRYTESIYDTSNTRILLWGRYKSYNNGPRGFIEVQIPKILEYPVPGNQNWNDEDGALIHGINYLKEGVILYTRFKEVAKYVR